MKYIFFFFALLAFASGCAKTTKKSYEEGSSTIVRKFKKGEKNPAYTDEYYSKSEFIKCSYSFDDENKRVIVLGNKNFNAESDIVNHNGKDIKCIYFSMYDIPFEPSEYTLLMNFSTVRSVELSSLIKKSIVFQLKKYI